MKLLYLTDQEFELLQAYLGAGYENVNKKGLRLSFGITHEELKELERSFELKINELDNKGK